MSHPADSLASMLAHARRAAEATPESRNRYIDFLRAASIVAVVLGHWLVITPWVDGAGAFHPDHLLTRSRTGQWLTWVFQVMPVFFAVGGYANAASWESARAKATSYAAWLQARLVRLIRPTAPLLVTWILITALTPVVFPSVLVETGSVGALSPLWFLAVYLTPDSSIPLAVTATVLPVLDVISLWLIARWSGNGHAWDDRHRLALVAGLLGFFIYFCFAKDVEAWHGTSLVGFGTIVGLFLVWRKVKAQRAKVQCKA